MTNPATDFQQSLYSRRSAWGREHSGGLIEEKADAIFLTADSKNMVCRVDPAIIGVKSS
jgi:hypothetical protein